MSMPGPIGGAHTPAVSHVATAPARPKPGGENGGSTAATLSATATPAKSASAGKLDLIT